MIKEVKLLIDFDEEDDILLGYLDFILTSKFKMKEIIVGEENLKYK